MNYPKQRYLYVSIKRALRSIMYSSIAAISLSSINVAAQSNEGEEDENLEGIEEIRVTGSRIRTDGMNAATPVTVVTLEELQLLNPASLVDGLAELPQFQGSFTTENYDGIFSPGFTSPGAGTLSLRGLQGKRTLSLLDGKRIVSSSIFGGPDVNLFPLQLLRTVESVTGGASAAYGTDAVAGAVNFILNKKYEGFNASVRTGATQEGKFKSRGLSASGGFALSEKTHLLFSAEMSEQDPELGLEGFDWYNGARLLDNPDANAGETRGNPLQTGVRNVYSRNSSLDGIIHFPLSSFGQPSPAAGSFIELYGSDRFIVNSDGSASPFIDGTYSDDNYTSAEGGGSGTINDYYNQQLMPESERESYFAGINHDVTDQLAVSFEVMYGKSFNRSRTTQGSQLDHNSPFFGTFAQGNDFYNSPLIFSGNPYIPENVQQIMTDNFMPFITVGKAVHPDDLDKGFRQQNAETLSLNLSFDYKIESDGMFDGWLVKGYYQSGTTDTIYTTGGILRHDRVYLAYDAVEDPLNPGNIICNVSQYLDAPENAGMEGCVPINPFGRGNANSAAVDWITDYEAGVAFSGDGYFVNENGVYDPVAYNYTSSEYKKRIMELKMDNWELSADGVLSENGFGAGAISMALGVASRTESFVQTVQAPGSNPSNNNDLVVPGNNAFIGRRGIADGSSQSNIDLFYSNVPFAKGEIKVNEAFVEFLIPVLADLPLIDRFDVGLAARYADYKDIDKVTSWKYSSTWTVNEQLSFRGTVSKDVRAPGLAERYDRTGEGGYIRDVGIDTECSFAPSCAGSILATSYGSVDLTPENARTETIGLVYRPDWLEGFSFAMDYYHIKIEDNINQLTVQGVVDACHIDGIQSFCDLITRNGPLDPGGSGLNRITFVFNPYVNQDYTESSGVDFEFSYNTAVDWFGGGEFVGFRVLGSYMDSQVYTTDGVETEWVDLFWAPWTATMSANYNRGPLSFNLSTNWQSTLPASQTANQFDEDLGRIVWNRADNENKDPIVVTAAAGYNFELKNGSRLNLGLNIRNLFDKGPRFDPGNFSGNGVRGDLRGRAFDLSLNYTY